MRRHPLTLLNGSLASSLTLLVAVACTLAMLGAPAQATAPEASVGLGHLAATAAPRPVNDLRAYDRGATTSLQWANPTTTPFDHVVVRYAKGTTAPANPRAGHGVSLARPKATSARLSGLARDTRYAVAVWAVDRRHRHSTARTVRFTTDATPAAGATYTGLVTDTAGNPLLGARIEADDYATFDSTVTATSDTNGVFLLHLPAGQWFVSVDGAQATGGNSDPSGYLGRYRFVRLSAGDAKDGGTFALRPGGAITGRITDTHGHPLAGVTPYAAPVTPYVQTDGIFGIYSFDESSGTTTRPDGTFTLTGVWPGDAVLLCVDTTSSSPKDAPGYGATCARSSTLVSAGALVTAPDLTLVPARGATVSGTVRAPAGHPISGYVTIERRTSHSVTEAFVQTDPDGSYRVDGLAAGTYRVCAQQGPAPTASRTGYAPGCAAHHVTVTAGHTATVNVTLQPGAAVTGTVVGRHGVPLAGVGVYVHGAGAYSESRTDARGHYTAKGLRTGEVVACFDTSAATGGDLPTGAMPGCYQHHRKFAVRARSVRTGIDAHLHAGGAVSGTVTDTDGTPLQGVEVDVESRTSFDNNGGYAETGARGHYTVRGLATGSYAVCVFDLTLTSSQTEHCHRGAVAVRAGHTVRHVDSTVPTTSSVTVSVHDTDGHPVAGVDAVSLSECSRYCDPVPLFDPKSAVHVNASDTTQRDGTVTLDGLRPGRHAICLFGYYGVTAAGSPPTGYADACTGGTFDVVVTKGAVTPVSLVLPPGGAVSGTVTDGRGRPLGGVRVAVSHSAAGDYPSYYPPDDGPAADSVTAANGSYTIRSVTPGAQTVCFDPSRVRPRPSTGSYLRQCIGGPPGKRSGGMPVSIAGGTTTGGIDLSLAATAAIRGRITNPSGRPVRHAVVIVLRRTGKQVVAEAQTGSHGRFTVKRLAPGSYAVCIYSDRYASQCYRHVPWPDPRNYPPVASATSVTTTVAHTTGGIDAKLRDKPPVPFAGHSIRRW